MLLHQDAHLVVEKVLGEPILVVRRTSSVPEVDAVLGFAATLRAAFTGIDRSRHAMLADLRLARLRSVAGLEEALQSFRAEVGRDAIALARLVTTSVGALQVTRMDRDELRPNQSFADEEEALTWLRRELARHKQARGK